MHVGWTMASEAAPTIPPQLDERVMRTQSPTSRTAEMAFRTRKWLAPTLVFAVVASFGCSKQDSTKEANLSRANEYFAAGQYDKAEKEYFDLLRATPENPLATLRLGSIYHDQAQNLRAYPLLKKSAELAPEDMEVQLKLGLTLLPLGQFKDAREAALRVLEKEPGREEALVLLANTAIGLNDVDAMRQYIEGLRAKDQDRIGYHLALGLLDLRQNNLTGAESQFKAALALNSKSPEALSGLGSVYWRRNELPAAEESYKAAAQLAVARSPTRLAYAEFKLRTGAPEQAKAIYEDLVRQVPDFLPPQVALMKLACAQRHDDCATRVQAILARDLINYDAVFQDGLNNLAKGDAPKAVREFEYLSTTYIQNPRVRYQLALAYLQLAQKASLTDRTKALAGAENSLANAIKLDPRFEAAVIALADLKIRKGVPAAAVDLVLPFVNNRATDPRLHFLLASAYLAQQQPDRALPVYQRMTDLFPKDPQPPFLIARILLARQQPAEARTQLEKSLEIFPAFLPALENLVDLDLADKRFDDATNRIHKAIESNPKLAVPWVLSAKVAAAQRDLAKAEADLSKATELDPNLEAAYLGRSQLYVMSNRQEQAIAELKAFIEKHNKEKSKTASAWLQLAMIQQSMNRFDASREAYEKFLEIAPNSVLALNNLAVLYSENLGQIDRAYDLAKKANELSPNQPNIADTFGWILFKKRDYENALRVLQDSAAKSPDSPEIQFHVGMAHYMMGDEVPARAALQKAVDASAQFLGKDDARRRLAILSIDPAAPSATVQGELDIHLRERSNDPMAQLRRAQLEERQGSPDQAIKSYEMIVQNNAQFAPAQRRLALLYARHSSDLRKASEVAQKVRQAYPDDPHVTDALGWIEFRNGDYNRALPLLWDSANKLPDDPEVQFHLGMANYMLGDEAPARTALQKAVDAAADFPGKADARRRLEVLSIQVEGAGNSSAARTQLENFLRENPNDSIALFRLARLQEQDGAVQQAIGAYERILAGNSSFSPALRQLAILYGRNPPADLNKAFETASRARQVSPNDPEITKTLGILNYRRSFYPQAAEQLKAAAASRKDDGELFYYLGETYHQLKQPKDCQEAINSALNLNLPARLLEQAKRVQADCASAAR